MTAVLILWGHALAALLFGTLALARWRRRADRAAGPVAATVAAAALTALWALAVAGVDARDVSAHLAEGVRNLAWMGVMGAFVLRARADGGALAALYAVVMFVMLAAAMLALIEQAPMGRAAIVAIEITRHVLRMMAMAGGLLLLCHLAQVATGPQAGGIRLFALALAAMWGLDLGIALVAFAGPRWTTMLVVARGPVMTGVAVLLAIAATHRGGAALSASRAVTTRALTGLILLLYITATALAVDLAASLAPSLARAVQTAIVCGATAALLALASTPWLRAWLRVKAAKHLFDHRYDYRVEWQRFTTTLGLPGPGAAPLGERIAKAVADLTDSPASLLLVAEEGALVSAAGWRWPDGGGPLPEALAMHLAATGRIVSLDALRGGGGPAAERAAVPASLLADDRAWAIVPLLHGGALAGAILLARPPVDRALDWEDFDLLRIVGRQAASYLAEDRSQAALVDAQQFDAFNRRFAFLLHDIKNVASQLTLVARNAERHADNPAFRADMVATLRESAGRMTTLLARLGQHDGQRVEPLQAIDLTALVTRVAAGRRAQHSVIVEGVAKGVAWGHPIRLEQALSHLVQNAVEASAAGEPVRLAIAEEGERLILAVIDRGGGMAPGFVRDQLFRPFLSSKPEGFGIGAYEARQLIRAMGGELQIDSREGEGSIFRILLPVSPATTLAVAA